MNIMDLAKAIGPDCKTEIVGIRPGEKLHEVMIPKDDARNTVEFDDYFVIKPDYRYFNRRFNSDNSQPVPDDYEYSSGTNSSWLTIEELQNMVKNL